ncbi:MAG TPA: sigma-70 family RNA polymerase sigma factor [Myxococcota bacterium]|nr:sigma-70 family RNA polymerase sigma factor [Myxococcota bacterium]
MNTNIQAQGHPSRGQASQAGQDTSTREQTSSNRPDEGLDLIERDRLAMRHRRLVEAIARRIHVRLPKSVELDDLIHEGFAGLLEAIDRYDSRRSVPLEVFASRRISGAIYDMLRDLDWVPRTVRRRAEHLERTRDTLEQSLGRSPNREEMATALGLQACDVERYREEAQIRRLTSLDTPISEENRVPLVETIAVEDDIVEARADQELRAAMLEAVERLPAKERAAVRGFYLEERPLVEVGRELGVSESRASQLHRIGVERLRYKVREHLKA